VWWVLEPVRVELLEDEVVELWVPEPLEDPVWAVEVLDELGLDEELETVEVSVVVEVSASELLASAWLEPPPAAPSAPIARDSWPPNPTAVMPPPASADSAARRAQRRGMLIGDLLK
jgi:hypothetical protein